MSLWLVRRPLEEVQAVANWGGSHLPVIVVAGELEDRLAAAVPAQVAAVAVPAQVAAAAVPAQVAVAV